VTNTEREVYKNKKVRSILTMFFNGKNTSDIDRTYP